MLPSVGLRGILGADADLLSSGCRTLCPSATRRIPTVKKCHAGQRSCCNLHTPKAFFHRRQPFAQYWSPSASQHGVNGKTSGSQRNQPDCRTARTDPARAGHTQPVVDSPSNFFILRTGLVRSNAAAGQGPSAALAFPFHSHSGLLGRPSVGFGMTDRVRLTASQKQPGRIDGTLWGDGEWPVPRDVSPRPFKPFTKQNVSAWGFPCSGSRACAVPVGGAMLRQCVKMRCGARIAVATRTVAR